MVLRAALIILRLSEQAAGEASPVRGVLLQSQLAAQTACVVIS